MAEDLLDEDVEAGPDLRLQRPNIILRIGEAVDMVDPQPLDPVGPHQFEDERMGPFENGGLLDAHPRQRVDVEEAAVVDVARRDAPVRQPVALQLEDAVERVEAFRDALGAVNEVERPVRRFGQLRRIGKDPLEAALERLALGDEAIGPGGGGVLRQRPQPRRDREQLPVFRPRLVGGEDQDPVEQDRIAQRADREAVLEMPEAEAAAALVARQLQLTLLERIAIAPAEEGQHQLAVGAEALPVDVEGHGMGRELPPFDHREPPRIVGAADAHMVGHDVEDQAETFLLQRLREPKKAFFPAEFRIDPHVVDDVVAMGRARPRCLDRRGIDMADAELGQIGQDRDRVVEGEAGMELQPVGRPRWRRR